MTTPNDPNVYSDQQTTGRRTVVCLFGDPSRAEAAIRDLKDAGFREEQIGVAMKDRSEQKDLMDNTGSPAAEGAATGAVSGGIVGGLIGLLGSLLIPGLGPIVVGGVLASTLTGVGIGAATGGLIGALAGMGVPEADAQHFDTGLRSGGALVTVTAEVSTGEARTGEAIDILQRHGGDLGPSGPRGYGLPGYGPPEGDTGIGDRVADVSDVGASTGMAAIGLGTPGTAGDQLGVAFEEDEPYPSAGRERWEGDDRRRYNDPSYAGPERRLVGI